MQDLGAADFTVYEDGRLQALQRFQRVTDLPLQIGMLVDTSASMEAMLPSVQEAALRFFRDALRPTDRAAVVTFSEEPRLAAPFTRDLTQLGAALVGLQAARGTALWDSVVYTLHYFQGTPGRRALLVFSDGADHGSRYTFDQALAYAEHSGVSVYALSFGGATTALLEGGRRRLANLAEATGGRSFVLAGPEELRRPTPPSTRTCARSTCWSTSPTARASRSAPSTCRSAARESARARCAGTSRRVRSAHAIAVGRVRRAHPTRRRAA